jgi:hypothetical protein
MTETKTFPNGVTATPIPVDNGWTVTAYRQPGSPVSKLIAVAPGGKMAIHREKVADSALEAIAAEMTGATKVVTEPVDVMAALSASIDIAKAKKAS